MHLLFICSRNKWRSRTAETIFKKYQQHAIKSAGTAQDARIKVTENLINWADLFHILRVDFCDGAKTSRKAARKIWLVDEGQRNCNSRHSRRLSVYGCGIDRDFGRGGVAVFGIKGNNIAFIRQHGEKPQMWKL